VLFWDVNKTRKKWWAGEDDRGWFGMGLEGFFTLTLPNPYAILNAVLRSSAFFFVFQERKRLEADLPAGFYRVGRRPQKLHEL
jgi:hypothetical protein